MIENIDLLQGQLPVGLLASLVNISVHAVIMTVVTWTAHRAALATQAANVRMRLVVVMTATVTVLMAAHIVEVGIWAITYRWVEAVQEKTDAFYFAFVNYTTLGYGDVLPVKQWRLLGPMAAMNGVLLFGWSTAVIYDILRTVARVIPMSAPETNR